MNKVSYFSYFRVAHLLISKIIKKQKSLMFWSDLQAIRKRRKYCNCDSDLFSVYLVAESVNIQTFACFATVNWFRHNEWMNHLLTLLGTPNLQWSTFESTEIPPHVNLQRHWTWIPFWKSLSRYTKQKQKKRQNYANQFFLKKKSLTRESFGSLSLRSLCDLAIGTWNEKKNSKFSTSNSVMQLEPK